MMLKQAVYLHFAEHAARPTLQDLADRTGAPVEEVKQGLQELRAQRVLLLEPDGVTIRMAPPFSAIPTQHVVESRGRSYYANCAWDALAIPAALHAEGRVRSRCEQSHEPLDLRVGLDGPQPCDWLFHCEVPAAKWWDDLVFT